MSSLKDRLPEKQKPWIILVLGFLTSITPLSIDMYLPTFPELAQVLHTTTASLSLSLSSYFIGVSIGQLCYGPISDRFGRKRPLYFGLTLYILSSLGCLSSHQLSDIVFWRFMTALGGCVASISTVAIVRDLFRIHEITKVFSMLMLVMGVSPLVAPSIGSTLAVTVGWQGVFILLIVAATAILTALIFVIPESHPGDPSVELFPKPVLQEYWKVASHPKFYAHAFSGAAAFSTLFIVVASSPVIFFHFFHMTPQHYGFTFTCLAAGYIGSSQLNIFLQRFFSGFQILVTAIYAQMTLGIIFAVSAFFHWITFSTVFINLFLLLVSVGLVLPNATMIAMAPFPRRAGRASALMTSSQMLCAAFGSAGVSWWATHSMVPMGLLFMFSSGVSVTILTLGRRNPIAREPLVIGEAASSEAMVVH